MYKFMKINIPPELAYNETLRFGGMGVGLSLTFLTEIGVITLMACALIKTM